MCELINNVSINYCYSLSYMLNMFVTNIAGSSGQDKGKGIGG